MMMGLCGMAYYSSLEQSEGEQQQQQNLQIMNDVGKTSLLNALCGRAFYGEVTGKIHVNGNRTSIEEIKDSVGFVPQVSAVS